MSNNIIDKNDNIITKVLDGTCSEYLLKYYNATTIAENLLDHISYHINIKKSVNESIDASLLEYLKYCNTNNKEVDEGLIGGLLGTVTGTMVGPSIGKAICNALGVTKGVLYDLLNSRLVTMAICAKLGMRI